MLSRRTALAQLLASAALTSGCLATGSLAAGNTAAKDPARVRLGEASPFNLSDLLNEVKAMAGRPYVAPPRVPKAWEKLTYDQYKNINFKHTAALWRDTDHAFEMEFFAPGLYFPTPISISVVRGANQHPVLFDKNVFTITDQVPPLPDDPALNYSGFRLNTLINDPVHKSEFAVFQGASYFRAIGRGQTYGLSARGLALNTGDPKGEEFPEFRKFWVVENTNGSKLITIHALLDSPSVAGLYSFMITPGNATEMNVKAHVFPRVDLSHVGIAAETSMFLFDETNRHRFDDFRPAVHDNDGLLIENGAGETLWRQLANPTSLQISSFVDTNPKGFGLMQRARKLDNFADLQAHYHKRPGLWVVPGEDWGKGAVTLVEIPADREIYDNIVAYWRPREPLKAGSEHHYSYRLIWCDTPPVDPTLARVVNTRMGKRFSGGRLVTIDYSPTDKLPDDLSKITLHASANGGKVSPAILQRNPATGGVRLAFTFDPGDRTALELRAQLVVDGKQASEVWLYRWTA